MVGPTAERILVTGALGQIGTALTEELRRRYGDENVVASSRRSTPLPGADHPGPFERLDVTDAASLSEVIERNRVHVIYHLAAILSAVGETDPEAAWRVNVDGLRNVVEAAKAHGIDQVFWPSSIAVFGPQVPRRDTPQETVLRPTTMYGVCKVAGELLCEYYVRRYGLDVRSVRYPGIISSEAPPGGGTTDYAVEMFHAAVAGKRYRCFVREDTVLPMLYMPDCLAAALDLMAAERSRLGNYEAFNVAAMSFAAGELAATIAERLPEFACEYVPDVRQAIADSWPRSIDDAPARARWAWRPRFDMPAMTADMIEKLRARRRAPA